jgi:hypothetical protein
LLELEVEAALVEMRNVGLLGEGYFCYGLSSGCFFFEKIETGKWKL